MKVKNYPLFADVNAKSTLCIMDRDLSAGQESENNIFN
jgi:hypothetical protein